jgi:hypothetical protein
MIVKKSHNGALDPTKLADEFFPVNLNFQPRVAEAGPPPGGFPEKPFQGEVGR